jgi:hypothetical protein
MDQVVGLAFMGALEVLQVLQNLQESWNSGHSYDKTLEHNLLT